MKVLLVHNFYQSSSPSGEDTVFKNEIELLKKNGVDVITYEKHNDEIMNYGLRDKFLLPFTNIWSKRTYKEIKELIKREKPDIAHFHNIFYLISPSGYYACKDLGIPVVQTLHNFRFFCVNGLLMKNGRICEACIGKYPWRGVIYKCFRNSAVYSGAVASMDTFHRIKGTFDNVIDVYIALTESGRQKFIEAGLPEEKIFIKPNFVIDPPEPNFEFGNYVLFVGRLSREKGIMTLLKAWKNINGLSLKIAGDGPMKKDVEDYIEKYKIKNIQLLGRLSHNDVIDWMKAAMFVIFPSEWYETFLIAITESYACGKPVVASNLGAMAELVRSGRTGLLFEPGNPEDLTEKIQWMLENKEVCVEMGKNSRAEFEAKYTAERNYEILMQIYKKAIENKGNG